MPQMSNPGSITININVDSVKAEHILKAAENLGGNASELFKNESAQVTEFVIGEERINAGVSQSVFSIQLPKQFEGKAIIFWGEVQRLEQTSRKPNKEIW